MVNLKAIKAHAVSVGNIQKITNTIKMVATSKFMVAEKNMRNVRHFGRGTRKFYEVTKIRLTILCNLHFIKFLLKNRYVTD